MNDLTVMSIVNVMPSNKDEITNFANEIKDEIINSGDALKVLKQLKMIEKTLKTVFSDSEVKEALVDEASKYHKDELLTLNGCSYQVKEVGTKYDFSNTGDTVIFDLYAKQKELNDKVKERETFLKNLSKDSPIYNEEGIQLSRPSKSSETQVVLTIK